MKRAPRRPFKPWFKKRKPAGRLFNRSVNSSDNVEGNSQENLEIFVGYHKKNDKIDDIDDDDPRIIEFFVDDGCPYVAWKLYFPKKKFSESTEIAQIVDAMIHHFQRYPHWYDIDAVVENSTLDLRIENIVEDEAINWDSWFEDFKSRPEDVVNAIGLAIHSLLVIDQKNNGLKKIFVRPLSFKPLTNLNSITTDNVGELVTTRASIIHTGDTEYLTENLCFRCRECAALIAVQQKKHEEDEKFLEPTMCRESCKARKGMDPLYDSPFTLSYSRQIITVQTISHNFTQANKTFEVVVYRDLTDAFAVGQEVLITGIVKQAVENYDDEEKIKFKGPFMKKKDKESNPIILRTYIKCLSMLDSTSDESASSRKDDTIEMDLMTKLRADPRIFKVLLHSFCPSVAGKEVAKAFALIGLFGGHNLMSKWRRSSIHILLLGSSGTGKSAILQAAYECAPKGMAISGANITMAGLIAGCDEHMKAEAGVLALCDNGLLYIDELDKMEREQQQAMIASMDSEVIMIHKNGCFLKIPARTNILAAANPCTEIYDYNEPVIANMSFPHDLLEKFDVVVPFLPSNEEEIEEFLFQLEQKNKQHDSMSVSAFNSTSQLENEFFDASSSSSRKFHWLKKEAGENLKMISRKDIQAYIKHALEECCPKLSEEAATLLRNFYENYTVEMTREYEHVWSTMHNMESLIRMTLARARIDFSDIATVEHASQVLSLFKAAQIDVYPHHDIKNDLGTSSSANTSQFNLTTMFNASIKKKDVEIGKLSKPKQMKELLRVLQEKSDDTGSNLFTMPKLLEIAIELGIKDYYEIINRLNYDGFLLKTPNGYKLVKDSL